MYNPMQGMFQGGGPPIQAGRMRPPGQVQTPPAAMPSIAGVQPQTGQQAALGQQLGANAQRANTGLQRAAAPQLAQLNAQRQGAVEQQGLNSAQFDAGRYQQGLSNDLRGRGMGLTDANLGLGDQRLNLGDQQLGSQYMRANAGLANQRMGQMNGLLPFLMQYFGVGG